MRQPQRNDNCQRERQEAEHPVCSLCQTEADDVEQVAPLLRAACCFLARLLRTIAGYGGRTLSIRLGVASSTRCGTASDKGRLRRRDPHSRFGLASIGTPCGPRHGFCFHSVSRFRKDRRLMNVHSCPLKPRRSSPVAPAPAPAPAPLLAYPLHASSMELQRSLIYKVLAFVKRSQRSLRVHSEH